MQKKIYNDNFGYQYWRLNASNSFWIPGVEKGTQAKILSDKFSIPHISTGDILREAAKNGARLSATPQGGSKKQSAYQKSKSKKEYRRRNQIEGKIGQSKQGYGLNCIKAKLKNTFET